MDIEGHVSPSALLAYCEFLHRKRAVPGQKELRAADNWQLGMSLDDYAESLVRHVVHFWAMHRGAVVTDEKGTPENKHDLLCATLFNAFGYLHELIKAPRAAGRAK
jgi:hypothetical protein